MPPPGRSSCDRFSPPAPPGPPRRALIGEQRGNSLLRRGEALSRLSALAALLIEPMTEVADLIEQDGILRLLSLVYRAVRSRLLWHAIGRRPAVTIGGGV